MFNNSLNHLAKQQILSITCVRSSSAYHASTRGDSRTENEGTDTTLKHQLIQSEMSFITLTLNSAKRITSSDVSLCQEETGQQVQFTIITDMIMQ